MTGLIAAIGISLHNFPEGLIVYSQTITGICDKPLDSFTDLVTGQVSMDEFVAFLSSCTGRGLAITFAIALHNIPGLSSLMQSYLYTQRDTVRE